MKQKQSVALKVFLSTELIIGARILLFSVPVILNKSLGKTFSPGAVGEWFIIVMTLTAVLYFFIGAVSLLGFAQWKIFHYVAAVVVLFLTAGLMNVAGQHDVSVKPIFFLPPAMAVLSVIMMNVLSGRKHEEK